MDEELQNRSSLAFSPDCFTGSMVTSDVLFFWKFISKWRNEQRKTTPHRRTWEILISESGPLDSMDQSTATALFPWAKDSQEDVLPKRDSEAFDYLLTDMCQCFGEKKNSCQTASPTAPPYMVERCWKLFTKTRLPKLDSCKWFYMRKRESALMFDSCRSIRSY